MYSHYLAKKKRRPVELAEEAVKKTIKSKKVKFAANEEDDDGDAMQTDEPDETLLVRDPDTPSTSQRTKMWFAQDLFKDVDLGEDDEAADQLHLKKMMAERSKKRKIDENGNSANTGTDASKSDKKVRFDPDDLDTEDDSSSDEEDSYEPEPTPQYAEEDEDDDSELEDAFDDDDLTVEEKARMMALAKKMVGNSKDRSELARAVYNKYPYTSPVFPVFPVFPFLLAMKIHIIYALTLP
jgi:hypothetical protein